MSKSRIFFFLLQAFNRFWNSINSFVPATKSSPLSSFLFLIFLFPFTDSLSYFLFFRLFIPQKEKKNRKHRIIGFIIPLILTDFWSESNRVEENGALSPSQKPPGLREFYSTAQILRFLRRTRGLLRRMWPRRASRLSPCDPSDGRFYGVEMLCCSWGIKNILLL